MEKIAFGFVILHYQVFDMTVQCVENLFSRFDMSDKFVVIVDNASPNGSGKKLEEKYRTNNTQIMWGGGTTVIRSNQNLGFAQGNNLGYKFLKANFDVDFIVIMNNDVFIYQDDFFDKTKEIYTAKKFHVLGPDIYNPNDGNHQNPILERPYSYDDIVYTKNLFARLAHPKYYAAYDFLHYCHVSARRKLGNIKRILLKQPPKPPISRPVPATEPVLKPRTEAIPMPMDNCCLHGSCYIFSRDFIEARSHAFNSSTFMYFEEQLLQYECLKSKMLMTYSPDIKVQHLSHISTNASLNNASQKKKELFNYKNNLKTVKILLKLMEKDNFRTFD